MGLGVRLLGLVQSYRWLKRVGSVQGAVRLFSEARPCCTTWRDTAGAALMPVPPLDGCTPRGRPMPHLTRGVRCVREVVSVRTERNCRLTLAGHAATPAPCSHGSTRELPIGSRTRRPAAEVPRSLCDWRCRFRLDRRTSGPSLDSHTPAAEPLSLMDSGLSGRPVVVRRGASDRCFRGPCP